MRTDSIGLHRRSRSGKVVPIRKKSVRIPDVTEETRSEVTPEKETRLVAVRGELERIERNPAAYDQLRWINVLGFEFLGNEEVVYHAMLQAILDQRRYLKSRDIPASQEEFVLQTLFTCIKGLLPSDYAEAAAKDLRDAASKPRGPCLVKPS